MDRSKHTPKQQGQPDWGVFDVELDGQKLPINPVEVCKITDISKGQREIASQIAFYGSLLGAAEKARDKAESSYRAWKSSSMVALMAKDPKIAEWKAKAMIESDPHFELYKDRRANHSSVCTRLYWLCRALSHQSEILRSLGATERDQFKATGMVTKEKE